MKKILITIIILLTITSAVLAYYNIQLKNENEKLKENQNIPANPDNNQNNDTCPIENEETISVDSAIIKNLLKTFSTKDCENHNLAKQFYSPQIITASKLDEKLLMFFVLRYYDDMIPKCTNSDVVTLEEESIKEAVGILFGTSIDFDKLDIKKNMTIQNYQIQYDKNTNNYTISNNNCDGCGSWYSTANTF